MARRHAKGELNLAGGGAGQTPPAKPAAASPLPPSGLTPVFNASAKPLTIPRMVSVAQIEALKKLLSKPIASPAPSPLGRVHGSYDPARDRDIRHEIKSIQTAIAKHQDKARRSFQAARLVGTSKQSFNNAVRMRKR